jgi:hypothetical protein
MKFEYSENKGERQWGASVHAVKQFIERNRFFTEENYRYAHETIIEMINKATLVTYDMEQNSDIYYYGSWIFVCKDSTIVTIYERKGSKWEHLII